MTTKDTKSMQQRGTVDPGNLLLISYLLGLMILALLSWCGAAGAVPAGQTISPDEIRQGQLLLPTADPGRYLAAPMLSMDVDIRVSGITARTTLKQIFTNDSDDWIEALYVFPLPDESGVDHLQMRIGERIIIAEIQEKKEARTTYEAARKAGKKASLLSQQRPNIFTTAVANIGPGETVIVQIEYQQAVKRHNNSYSLRFPMVVGPRYRPGACSVTGPAADSSDGAGPDADALQPGAAAAEQALLFPVSKPEEEPVNPVRLHVELAAGFEPAKVVSLYHGIERRNNSDGSVDITFNGEIRADRDFVLEWEPEKSQVPVVTLFTEEKEGNNYMLLMVMPPEQQQQEPLARETIFVLDTSGSMGGESIRQAKKALLMAVARMRPQDRFNVIEFNSTAQSLFVKSLAGSSANLEKAYSFINQLEARGGTEIKQALELALDGRNSHDRIRQVVFLTDACVGNEKEIFTLINQRLGDSRLFTVGIGSAPNSYFMTRAAAMGRGSHTYIGKMDEVRQKMTALFTMLEQPVITDLVLSGGQGVEIMPSPLPDLYQGEPLTALIKSRGALHNLQLSGTLAAQTPWQVSIDTQRFTSRPGISVIWARKKIRELMDSLSAGADPEQVKKKVTGLALSNHLVSRYTSLVAVEQKVSRPDNGSLRSEKMKRNLPAGWQYDKVFAGSAATATPASLLLLMGLVLLAGAALVAGMFRGKR